MATKTAFASLCLELSHLHIRILRRDGSPAAIAREAVALLRARQHVEVLDVTSSTMHFVPGFLQSCSTFSKHLPQQNESDAMMLMEHALVLGERYVGNNLGDINQRCGVLRSIMTMEEANRKLVANTMTSSSSSVLVDEVGERLSGLIHDAFHGAHQSWMLHTHQPTTLSMLSLIRGVAHTHTKSFRFSSTGSDQHSLLPTKTRVEMEAKMQRARGARELFVALRSMELSRLDAGMALSMMADLGLYDGEVCDECCHVLHASHPMLTSQQLCQIIFSLGVLQHRHVHQKMFASLMRPKEVTADGLRRHVLGLAMLRQQPMHQESWLDGIFLHALRHKHANRRHAGGSSPSPNHHHRNNNNTNNNNYNNYYNNNNNNTEHLLPPSWFIDLSHAMSCLQLRHAKFMLLTARHIRRSLAHLTTQQRCKLLYGLGGMNLERDVPDVDGVHDAWKRKVEPVLRITIDKLRDIQLEDGPRVMSALLFAGVREHPRIPVAPSLHDGKMNPVEQLLRTWSTNTSSTEDVLACAEKIVPSHLGERPASTLTHVVAEVARACRLHLGQHERYRLRPLCVAVMDLHEELSAAQLLAVMRGLQQLKMLMVDEELRNIMLRRLVRVRDVLTADERQQCRQLLAALSGLTATEEMLELKRFCDANP